MNQIYRGIALIKHSSPQRFTMVAIYRNSFSGVDTISHLLEKPLVEREMRRHLLRTGLSQDEIDAAIVAAPQTVVDLP